MSQKIKAVISINHDRYRTRKGKQVLLWTTQTRVVRNIEVDEVVKGEPQGYFECQNAPETPLKWAEKLTWTLYSGEIRYNGEIVPVWGWSFNSKLPLLWGVYINGSHKSDSLGRISLWRWVGANRDINLGSLTSRWSFEHSYTYQTLCKRLGDDFVDSHLQFDEEFRCDKCHDGYVEREICEHCEGTGVK